MKREALLRHMRRFGCVVRREGTEHSRDRKSNGRGGVVDKVQLRIDLEERASA